MITRVIGRTNTRKSENEVISECVRWMHRQGWRPRRNHVGTFFTAAGIPVHMGEAGEADWSFMRPACVVFIEFKKPGEKPKKHQLEWIAKMRHLGYMAGWCDSLTGLQSLLAEWGAPCA
jgi:hypothetical protein